MKGKSNSNQFLKAGVKQSEIPRVYNRIAAYYNIWGRLAESKAHRLTLELAEIQNGQNILEVAVGTGLLFSKILKRNPFGKNEGIDLTPGMLYYAKKRANCIPDTNYNLSLGDVYNLCYPNGHFNLVISCYMMDLIAEEDFSSIIMKLMRVLSVGGKLILVNSYQSSKWNHRFWDWIYQINPVIMAGSRGISLTNHFFEAGLTNVKQLVVSQLGYPSEIVCGTKDS